MPTNFVFVTFHMQLSQQTRKKLEKITNSFVVREDVERWIDVLFQSARHFHPNCRCVLLSDQTTPLQLRPDAEIIRYASVPEDPLWSRLNAERTFLQNLPPNAPPAHIAFLDFDIIVNNILDMVFETALPTSWDVGLTYRVFEDMPINGGVILVRAGSQQQAIRFFDKLLEVYVEQYRTDQWWGEQRSLAAIAGDASFQQKSTVVCRDGFRIGLLPGFLFNHTPDSASDTLRVSPDVRILHFKGKRKTFMSDYWRLRHASAVVPGQRQNVLQKPLWALAASYGRLRTLMRAGQWG